MLKFTKCKLFEFESSNWSMYYILKIERHFNFLRKSYFFIFFFTKKKIIFTEFNVVILHKNKKLIEIRSLLFYYIYLKNCVYYNFYFELMVYFYTFKQNEFII